MSDRLISILTTLVLESQQTSKFSRSKRQTLSLSCSLSLIISKYYTGQLQCCQRNSRMVITLTSIIIAMVNLYRIMHKHNTLSIALLSLLAFSILAKESVRQLKEGQIVKEYIPRESYSYHFFTLPQIDRITDINVLLTTLTGKTVLLVSALQKMPTLDPSAFDLVKQSGAKSTIVLHRSQLSSEIYISIFAFEFSEVNIEVVVHRSNSSAHEIHLYQGTVQTYTLHQSEPIICFTIDSVNSTYISVFLNELAGNVEMNLLDTNNQNIFCSDSLQNRFICTFKPSSNRQYRVKVSSKEGRQSIFTISYKTASEQCFADKLNQPIYVTLPPLASYCFSFNINREVAIIFSAALTHIQQLQRYVQTTILINQKILSASNIIHRVIPVSDINVTCGSNNTIPCMVTVSFINTAESASSFSFVFEQDDAEIALFDGINQRVRDEGAWSASGRYFYYPVSYDKLIQIFFTARSLRSHYYLAAQFVSKAKFLSRNQMEGIYPSYVQEADRVGIKNSANYYSIILGSVPFASVGISTDQIADNCPDLDCFLVISIFPQFFKDSLATEYDEYDIEVSQQQTSLSLGQSKLGMLNRDEYFTYLIEPEDAVIEFQAMDRQGKSAFCLSAAAALANGTIIKTNQFRSDLQLFKRDKVERIFLKGEKDECAYQIKYLSNANPFQIVQLSHPYELSLSQTQISRFIYYHQNPTSFRVVHLLTSGDVEVRVLPINHANFTFSSLVNVPLDDFPIFTPKWGELTINSSNTSFCSNCYYLIAVTTPNKFIGQILFLRVHDPIPLTSNHILKAWLTAEFSTQTYIYHSLSTFELTFNLVSGQISVEIIDPRGEMVIRESIKDKRTFRIESLEYKGSVQVYSEQTRFTVRVAAVSQAIFYVQINRIHLTQRIFQGYPSRIEIGSSMTPSLQFISSEQSSNTLNLIVNLEDEQTHTLNFTATAEGKGGLIASDEIIRTITRSELTYTLTLNNLPARYFIAIKTSTPINATILLAKSALTFISPAQDYLFNGEGIYHISLNSKRVLLEVYSCRGDFSVFGSPSLSDLSNETKIIANAGQGHKILSILANSSYFLRVANSTEDTNLEYLLRYDYSIANPYDAIDAEDYEIAYESTSEGIRINMIKQVTSGDKPWEIVKADYAVFASDSKSDLHRLSRCAIAGDVIQKQSQASTILLDNKLLDGLHNQSIYVIGKTTITILMLDNPLGNMTKQMTLLSNTLKIQLPTQQVKYIKQPYKYWLTDNIFIFLLEMIIFCTFFIIAPYYVILICIRRQAMRQQNMAEEEKQDRIGTQQEIAGQSGNLPETGNKMIKEHI